MKKFLLICSMVAATALPAMEYKVDELEQLNDTEVHAWFRVNFAQILQEYNVKKVPTTDSTYCGKLSFNNKRLDIFWIKTILRYVTTYSSLETFIKHSPLKVPLALRYCRTQRNMTDELPVGVSIERISVGYYSCRSSSSY